MMIWVLKITSVTVPERLPSWLYDNGIKLRAAAGKVTFERATAKTKHKRKEKYRYRTGLSNFIRSSAQYQVKPVLTRVAPADR
jgi:hypothetical protein